MKNLRRQCGRIILQTYHGNWYTTPSKSQLDGLIVPEQGSILQAGQLLEDLPLMWDKAQLEERHTILKGFLECVYVDLAEPPTLAGIKPKPQFLEFLGRVGTEEGAPGKSENEDSDAENASESSCNQELRGKVALLLVCNSQSHIRRNYRVRLAAKPGKPNGITSHHPS